MPREGYEKSCRQVKGWRSRHRYGHAVTDSGANGQTDAESNGRAQVGNSEPEIPLSPVSRGTFAAASGASICVWRRYWQLVT